MKAFSTRYKEVKDEKDVKELYDEVKKYRKLLKERGVPDHKVELAITEQVKRQQGQQGASGGGVVSGLSSLSGSLSGLSSLSGGMGGMRRSVSGTFLKGVHSLGDLAEGAEAMAGKEGGKGGAGAKGMKGNGPQTKAFMQYFASTKSWRLIGYRSLLLIAYACVALPGTLGLRLGLRLGLAYACVALPGTCIV